MFRIETGRLILKPHTMDNLERLHRWDNDPEVIHYNDDQPEPYAPRPVEETRAYLGRVTADGPADRPAAGGSIHYAIHLEDTGEFIGYGMIAHVDRYHRRCKVGITIGERDMWGRGYARETMAAVLEYCFDTLGLNRVAAEVYAYNERSIRLFEGLGFTREGVAREEVLKRGRFEDAYQYGMLRREWEMRL